MFVRLLAGMLGISVALCAAVAARSPLSPTTATVQGEALPPPPLPAVLPAVPNVAPGYAGPANAPLPNGDLVGVDTAVRRHRAARRDHDGAAAQHRSRGRRIRTIASRTIEIVAAKGAYDVAVPSSAARTRTRCSRPLDPFEAGPNGGPITQISRRRQRRVQRHDAHRRPLQRQRQRSNVDPTTTRSSTATTRSTKPRSRCNCTQPLLRGAGARQRRSDRQLPLAQANAQAQTAPVLDAGLPDRHQRLEHVLGSRRRVAQRRDSRRRAAQRASAGRFEPAPRATRRRGAGRRRRVEHADQRLSRQRLLGAAARAGAADAAQEPRSWPIRPIRCGSRTSCRRRPCCSCRRSRSSTT